MWPANLNSINSRNRARTYPESLYHSVRKEAALNLRLKIKYDLHILRQFSQIKDSFCQPQFVSNPHSAKLSAFVISTELLMNFRIFKKNLTWPTVLIKAFLSVQIQISLIEHAYQIQRKVIMLGHKELFIHQLYFIIFSIITFLYTCSHLKCSCNFWRLSLEHRCLNH